MTMGRVLYVKLLVVCEAVFGVVTTNAMSQESASYPIEPIPMNLEVDIPGDRYYVGENFPVAIRIVNPNSFDVFLGGFQFGPLEPHTEIAFPEGTAFPEEARQLENQEFIDISLGGTISAMGGPPVLVPAGDRLEHRRLIYIGTKLDMGHWVVMPAGTYRMRIRPTMGAVTPREPRGYPKVDWTSGIVEFRLTMPAGRDRAALEFLRTQALELVERERNPEPGFRRGDFKLGIYREFLERFSGTIYETEIRWRIAKLLIDALGNRGIPKPELPAMVDLFDECLTFCLEKGGAYAEEFAMWEADGRGSNVLELAFMHRRGALFKRLVEEIDRKYPDDAEAILYRRVIVAGITESFEKAREVATEMRERFPNGTYMGKLDSLLRNLERQHARQRSTPPTP